MAARAGTAEKLLRGKGFRQQAGAAGTCTAHADDSWVRVVTSEADQAADLQPTVGTTCTTEPVAALGTFGSISFACKNRPRAELHMIAGTNFVEYLYEPGREPTPRERALLIDLGKRAQAARRAMP